MNLLQVDRNLLLMPLQAVGGVVERRHTLPILSNVLLEVGAGKLSLTATDLEIQVAAEADASEAADVQATTVSARKLLDILRSLPDATTVSLELQDKRLQLRAGPSKFSLQTLPAQDFPKIAAGSAPAAQAQLPQKDLKRLLALVQYAMAQQDIRYYLNGLLLSLREDALVVVATDGHRLALATHAMPLGAAKTDVILPRKAILELAKLLADTDDPVTLRVSDNQASFAFGRVSFVTKLVDGKFPDYQKVIPAGYKKGFVCDRSTLQQALQRAAILSNEKFRGVRWVLTADSLRIVCSNSEHEEAEEELAISYGGEALDVGFNVTYLLDVLGNVQATQLECALGDSNSSMLMTIPGNPDFKYVVMPMRI
ncbi:MAG TPA: DNA polymerase III subunit beta [Burkholderiales bacterium]|nr:DNA polymerase III subunit beta [Burkholderiales bacterium]